MTIPGKRPRLIATDLDGTIIPHDGPISKRNIDAFTAAHHLGIEIFIVTGRPPRWMREVARQLPFAKAICCNGALLYDLATDQVLEQWLIPVEAQKETVRRLREVIPHIAFAVDINGVFSKEKNYHTVYDIAESNLEKIEEVMREPAMKMLARCAKQEFTSDEMLALAHNSVSDLVTVTHSNPLESLLEISALGINKGTTLARMAERAGIAAEDVVAFGDNPNDFPMLEWAGRSWAMADGHSDAPNYANFVADPHHHDGVAIVIEELLTLPE